MALTTSEAVAQAVEQHSASPAGESDAPAVNESPSADPVSTQTPADATGLVARQPSSSSTAPPASQESEDVEAPKDAEARAKWRIDADKFDRVVQNTKRKTDAKVRSEIEGLLGVRLTDAEAIDHGRRFFQDPPAYIEWAYRELERMGRIKPPQPAPAPQTRQPEVNGNGFKKPVPSLVADNGMRAYDAEAIDAHIAHITQTFDERLEALRQQMSPLTEMQQRLEHQHIQAEAHQHAASILGEMQSMDGFEELRPKIKAMMERDGRVTIHSAYAKLYNSEYLPQQRQKIRQQTLDELKKRPVPPTGVSPSAAPRSSSAVKNGIRTAREAVEFAVQKHS